MSVLGMFLCHDILSLFACLDIDCILVFLKDKSILWTVGTLIELQLCLLQDLINLFMLIKVTVLEIRSIDSFYFTQQLLVHIDIRQFWFS